MNLKEIELAITPWTAVLAKWHEGKQIDRNEVIKLLESGEPIDPKANEFLAKALAGEVKFKRGNKPWYPQQSRFYAQFVVTMVDCVEALIKDPASIPDGDEYKEGRALYTKMHHLTKRKNAKRTSARQQAKSDVAGMLGIEVRRVETLITERNRELKRMAAGFGLTVAKMKAVFEARIKPPQ